MYLETMGRILPEMGKKIVVDDSLEGLLPLLQLGPTAPGSVPGSAGSGGGGDD